MINKNMKRKNNKGKSKKFLPIILLLIFLCAIGSGSDDSNEYVSDLSTSVTTTVFKTDNIDVVTTTEPTNHTTTKVETTEEIESITISEDETEETHSITYEVETTTKQTSDLPKNSTFSVKFIDVGKQILL